MIEALSGDLESGIGGLLSAWTALVVTAARSPLRASAPSLPLGDGVAGIAVTSVAAKMSRIVAGVVAFGDRLVAICWRWARTTAFLLVLVAAALTPGPVRARGRAQGTGAPSRSGPCTRPA